MATREGGVEMVSVVADEANNYCRILTILGMEEEGDPVAKIQEMHDLLNHPEIDDFASGTKLEAAHQIQRWGTAHDRAKAPADWFWLVGYLAGKALASAINGDLVKAKHHCISSSAALCNWHLALSGDTRMQPGSADGLSDLERSLHDKGLLEDDSALLAARGGA